MTPQLLVTVLVFAPLLGSDGRRARRPADRRCRRHVGDHRPAVPRLRDRLADLWRGDLGRLAGALHRSLGAVHRCRPLPLGVVDPHRLALGGNAGGGDHRLGPRAPLQLGLHGARQEQAALLRLSFLLHLRHAGAGDRQRLHAAVLRLGRRGARQLSPDRLLVREAVGQRRGDQGVRRQPRRGFRLRPRHHDGLLGIRLHPFRRHLPAGRQPCPSGVELRRPELAAAGSGLRPALRRRDGQVGAVSAAHLAARRDGGPDAGLGPDPCGDHGDRRRLHGLPALADVRIRAGRQADRHRDRRDHRPLRRHRRPRAERHQAGDRLFDLLAARLHVRGRRRRRLPGRHVPPVHPRLLQGAAVPRRRLGDRGHAPRAGHAAHGRACGTGRRSPTRSC